jgi:hypothetical protein
VRVPAPNHVDNVHASEDIVYGPCLGQSLEWGDEQVRRPNVG